MKLTVKEGKANKIHIYVDDEYRATVDSDYWYSEKYRNLKEINDEELTELLDSVSFRRAYNKGLDFLSRRPYGVKELVKKLCEKGHEKEAAEKAEEDSINNWKDDDVADDDDEMTISLSEIEEEEEEEETEKSKRRNKDDDDFNYDVDPNDFLADDEEYEEEEEEEDDEL